MQLGDVDTAYTVTGDGPPLVLLHGGLLGGDTFAAQVPAFTARYRVWVPDRRGHGQTPDVDGPITYDAMTADTIAFLETVVGEPAHLVGWSDGGILGLLVALRRPALIGRMVAIGANFHTEGLIPGSGIGELGIDPMSEHLGMERARYEAGSIDGPDHWPILYEKVARLWREEPTLTADELAAITVPTLVLAGDDEPIHLAHTCALYEALPAGQLAIVPGTSHMLGFEKAPLVNQLILDFLAEDSPPATILPIRRRR